MSFRDAARLIHEALTATMSGDHQGAADRINALGRDSDPARMYGVCCAVATEGRNAAGILFRRVPDLAKGESWYVLHLRPYLTGVYGRARSEPWELFSERFLVACFNVDGDNGAALFRAVLTVSSEHYVRCVAQLFADVAGLSATAQEHTGRQVR